MKNYIKKKAILIILDGWGITDDIKFSAIYKAETPFYDSLIKKYPYFKLAASGTDVGLPKGVMGNSEVGHTNIGAGKVVLQSLSRIDEAIKNKSFFENKTLINAFTYAKHSITDGLIIQAPSTKKNEKVDCETSPFSKVHSTAAKVHLLGLLSDGGVHSHINHLKALCEMACKNDVPQVFIHAITDGRDTSPRSAEIFLSDIENYIKELNRKYNTVISLATVIGRFYAMDRDNRWNRTEIAYNALVNGEGDIYSCWQKAIADSYNNDITDEFIKPIILNNTSSVNEVNTKNDFYDSDMQDFENNSRIKEGDVVINFNFRTDRSKQITRRLLASENKLDNPLKLYYVSFTNYGIDLCTKKKKEAPNDIKVVFKDNILSNTLGEIISKKGLKQVRIAETEKYPHITYFFSGGREAPFPGETRILCPSPKVKTYDIKPEMSAYKIKDKTLQVIKENVADFICINFANADMVGHTGNLTATIKACEVVDECLRDIVSAAKVNYNIVITSDHGNAEKVCDSEGKPYTAHTTNKVPLIVIAEEAISDGRFLQKVIKNNEKILKLADVAAIIVSLILP